MLTFTMLIKLIGVLCLISSMIKIKIQRRN